MERSSNGLQFDVVSKAYGERRVISGLSCVFGHGLHFIDGMNGAGKTTLLEMAAGVAKPTWGRISWQGAPLPEAIRKRKVCSAYCPAQPAFYHGIAVADAVRLYGAMCDMNWARPRSDVFADFDPFSISCKGSVPFGELSFGWRRRVLLHMVFSVSPEILALDEPYVGLDEGAMVALDQLLSGRAEKGVSLITGHGPHRPVPVSSSMHVMESSDDGAARRTRLVSIP